MPTTVNLTPEKLALYRATAQRRREQAWVAARQAARLLKEQFEVTRVVVFGSLARESGFTRWSDVDIAAWGIAPEDTFRAIGAVMDLDTAIAVNLVDVNTCRPSLLKVIEQDGVELCMTPDDECEHEIFVMIRWDREEGLGVPLSQLAVIHADNEQTREAVEDWCYWVGRGYRF